MRWGHQAVDASDPDALPGLGLPRSLLTEFDTPEFRGMQFLEVMARSALNRVPGEGAMGGSWTINPYRGCQHACTYCFARQTHTYLDLDAGADFDTRVVVKVNIAEVLGRELASGRHAVDHVMLGTNTDPYQRAEGRYRLMPRILAELTRHRVGLSLLTKGTLVRRDLGLLAEAARTVPVSVAMSIAVVDEELRAGVEPGTPTTAARLDTVRAIRAAGLDCSVLAMPVLPGLTDSHAQLDEAARRLAAAGATSVSMAALHLRPGAREWFWQWLEREHPDLVPLYRQIYGDGSYASTEYRRALTQRVENAVARHPPARSRQPEPGPGRRRQRLPRPTEPRADDPTLF